MAIDPRVPLIRVNLGTVGALTAGSTTNVNLAGTSLPADTVDSIPSRLLHRVRGQVDSSGSLQGQVEDVVLSLVTSTAPQGVTVRFYGNDNFATTTPANLLFLGDEEFSASDFEDANGVFMGHIGGLSIPYRDHDNTGEFHIQIENSSTVNQPAGMKVEFTYRPAFPGGVS